MMTRVHAAALVAILVVLGGGVVAAVRLDGSPPATSAAPPVPVETTHVVSIPADRSTEVQIDDRWSIRVPAGGAGPAPATLAIEPVGGERVRPAGGTSLSAARLVLSSGQPTAPWTFVYHLDTPLPPDRLLYLLDDAGDGSAYGAPAVDATVHEVTPARVHLAALSPDRRTATVTVDHLSFKQWLTDAIGDLTHDIGAVFDQRTDAPTCSGPRPVWLTDAIYVDDQNAPMRVCTGHDPQQATVATVKVADNRGGALLFASPVRPTWTYQSVLGDGVPGWLDELRTAALGKLGIPASLADRTWLVAPGQQVHVGFAQAALAPSANPTVLRSRYTPETMAFGLIDTLLSRQLGHASPTWEYEALAYCTQGAAADAADGSPSVRTALVVAAKLAKCAVENVRPILDQLRAAMPASAWERLSPAIMRTADVAKGALGRLLLIAEATYIVTDIATTIALDPDALKINLFVTGPGSAPTGLTAQRKNFSGSLIVVLGWKPPRSGPVTGYQVTTSGTIASGTRTVPTPTLNDPDNYCSPTITYSVRAIGTGGTLSPAATVTINDPVDCTPAVVLDAARRNADGSVTVTADCQSAGRSPDATSPIVLLVGSTVVDPGTQQCHHAATGHDVHTITVARAPAGAVAARTTSPTGTKTSNALPIGPP
ncbi:hypothetical protein [Pseudonocardia sp. 73-21]|uniref:hypothetical protein n=1 Tax=Pseudonocardia sp. 73-21 TaxID=1895809 RepID=UPI00095CF6BE|nr:hypothetical protein [Pseudonocardia sp. 73-21]OJY45929.1 MAG: hypothetical protein BGP03_31180 [Pseudonocardia sp. 73-21]